MTWETFPRLSLNDLPADIRAAIEEKFRQLPKRLAWPTEPADQYEFRDESDPGLGVHRVVVTKFGAPIEIVPMEGGSNDLSGVDVAWTLEVVRSPHHGCWANAIPEFSGARTIGDTPDKHWFNLACKTAGFGEEVIHTFVLPETAD